MRVIEEQVILFLGGDFWVSFFDDGHLSGQIHGFDHV
eukprot:CAMPEP_0172464880 /NCGR_PEP_ID=MMETSP1065-20121228/51849_1 /TAXON_ID=265537 /ORGANISM="Amphiprora paludosa, Strain CCMP125" /LENGTH=36 /DNA_ID= /DNA_START= /DNA_END= /DNA_ORIENTATION=